MYGNLRGEFGVPEEQLYTSRIVEAGELIEYQNARVVSFKDALLTIELKAGNAVVVNTASSSFSRAEEQS